MTSSNTRRGSDSIGSDIRRMERDGGASMIGVNSRGGTLIYSRRLKSDGSIQYLQSSSRRTGDGTSIEFNFALLGNVNGTVAIPNVHALCGVLQVNIL